MTDLLTAQELRTILAAQVAEAGGAKKWLRKHKVTGCDHILNMISNGDAATLDRILPVLGYQPVRRFERVER